MPQEVEQLKKRTIYIPIENFYKDPAADLSKLLNVFWRGKWFITAFCMICTLITGIMIFLPKFEASAKMNVSKEAILSVENYLDSFPFKKEVLEELYPKSNQGNKKLTSQNDDITGLNTEYVDSHFSFRVNEKNEVLTLFWNSKQPDISIKITEKVLAMVQNFISNELENENTVRYNIYKTEFDSVSKQLEKIVKEYNSFENLSDAKIIFMQQYLIMKEKMIEFATLEKLQKKFIILEPTKLIVPSKSKKLVKIIITSIFSLIIASVIVLIYDIYRRSVSPKIIK